MLKRLGTLHAGRSALGLVATLILPVGSTVNLLRTPAFGSSVGALAQGRTVDRNTIAGLPPRRQSARLSEPGDAVANGVRARADILDIVEGIGFTLDIHSPMLVDKEGAGACWGAAAPPRGDARLKSCRWHAG